MKTAQWFALTIVLLVGVQLALVPQGAEGWGGRRRRRWFRAPRIRIRVPRVRQIVRTTVRILKPVVKVIDKNAGIISKVCCKFKSNVYGLACCVTTKVLVGTKCYKETRGQVNPKDLIGSYKVVKANKNCRDLVGRKRRSAVKDLECGARFFPADTARLKLMMCAMMELRNTCHPRRQANADPISSGMSRTVKATNYLLVLISKLSKDPSVLAVLNDTSCRALEALPICNPSTADVSLLTSHYNHTGYDPSVEPCRHINPRGARMRRQECTQRETFALAHMAKALMLLKSDVIAMYPDSSNPEQLTRAKRDYAPFVERSK